MPKPLPNRDSADRRTLPSTLSPCFAADNIKMQLDVGSEPPFRFACTKYIDGRANKRAFNPKQASVAKFRFVI